MSELLKFLNSHPNWREQLSNSPYNIKISQDGPYYLLKYILNETDFSYPVTRECRGHIVVKNESTGLWEFACRPFDKFFNYGEEYAAAIDWTSAHAEEKVDGSLIKVWFHNGEWHFSSNGVINALKDIYGEISSKLITKQIGLDTLPKYETHMFELVSPKTQIIIHYLDDDVYYLGSRDNITGKEHAYESLKTIFSSPYTIKVQNVSDVFIRLNNLVNEEGFVVVDKNYNRIKMKSDFYLHAARLSNNGILTYYRMAEIWLNDQTDDLIAYCPWHKEFAERCLKTIKDIENYLNSTWFEMRERVSSKKDLAAFLTQEKIPYKDYFFKKYTDSNFTPHEWLKGMHIPTLEKILKEGFLYGSN